MVGVVAFAIVVTRVAVAGALDLLWAEDGAIFVEQAVHGGLAAVARPYAGYLHLVPRLLAVPIVALPASWYGVASVLAAAAGVGGVASVVFAVARPRLSAPEAAAVGLIVAVVPAIALEAIGSIAHLQWFLLYAAVWIIVTGDPRFGWVLSLTAASSPLAIVLAPFASKWWKWYVPGMVAQVVTVLVASGSRSAPTASSDPLARFVSSVVVSPVESVVLGAVAILAVLVLAIRSGRSEAVWLVVAAVVFYAAAVIANGGVAARYENLPQMLMWSAAVVAVDSLGRWWRGPVLAAAVVLMAAGFAASTYRSSGHVSAECPVPVAPAGWDADCV